MVRMVRVLEVKGTRAGFKAEVPGRDGHFVRAETLPELRVKLRAAMADQEGPTVAALGGSKPLQGGSETALFITV
jgi:hypothetical protein